MTLVVVCFSSLGQYLVDDLVGLPGRHKVDSFWMQSVRLGLDQLEGLLVLVLQ